VPTLILLAVVFYLRAAVIGLAELIRSLLGIKGPATTQPPHFLDIPVSEKRLKE